MYCTSSIRVGSLGIIFFYIFGAEAHFNVLLEFKERFLFTVSLERMDVVQW